MVAEVKHTEAERLRAAIDGKLKQLVRMNRSRMDFMERLQQGKVIGVDIWDKKELWSNSPEKAYVNAQIEGVKEKVEFKNGNVLELPFQGSTFDLVTCAVCQIICTVMI